MNYNDLSISYQNNNTQLNIKKYSNGSRLVFKIVDSTNTFVFPDKSEVYVNISGQSIKANKDEYYGITSFKLSESIFDIIPEGKNNFSVDIQVNGESIYSITGGIIEFYPSCVFLEAIPK